MFAIKYAFGLFLLSIAIAWLEIQIEGKHGWAEKLPCWRPSKDSLTSKIFSRLTGGKEATGYHLALITSEFFVVHFPFFAGVSWNWPSELFALSSLPLLWIFEDFLWFVLNPHYGFKNFFKSKIKWHKKWLVFLPLDYFKWMMTSAVFIIIGVAFYGTEILSAWIITMISLAILTIIATAVYPLFKAGK